MADFEILSRASAFLVKPTKTFPIRQFGGEDNGKGNAIAAHRNVHVVTACHVVAPWKFRKYYPDEWLQLLNEKNTHYTLEIRNEDGTFMTQSDCLPRFYMHPSRDLAVLHLEDEVSTMEVLLKIGMTVHEIDARELSKGDKMMFHGHEVLGEVGDDGADLRKPFPHTSIGVMVDRTEHQSFVRTTSPLTDGMCGGPIIAHNPLIFDGSRGQSTTFVQGTLNSNSMQSSRKKEFGQNSNPQSYSSSPSTAPTSLVCGMLEGIVPLNHPSAALQGLASIIEGSTIATFLSSIEMGTARALEGGDAQKHVANDKDPDKMDLEKVIRRFQDETDKTDSVT